MNIIKSVTEARDEARRFAEYCDRYLERMQGNDTWGTKEMGSVKASSILLTRKLTEVRR